MMTRTMAQHLLLERRRWRAIFFLRRTQQVRSLEGSLVAREIARAAAALGAVAAWGVVLFLLAG